MNTCVISVVTVYSIEYHKSDYPSVRINIVKFKYFRIMVYIGKHALLKLN